MVISETKGQGWRAIPTQWKKGSAILTSTLAAFFTQKGKKDREAHLNYYTSAYSRGGENNYDKDEVTSQLLGRIACIA